MAEIHIIGCHHALQNVEICARWLLWEDSLKEIGKDVRQIHDAQKRRFAGRLEELVNERKVTFIGEEAEPNIVTWGSHLGIKWKNVDMPEPERKTRGIPNDYAGNPDYPLDLRARWDAEREEFMCGEFQRNLGDARSALLVCGSQHVHPLATRLLALRHSTSCEDVTHSDWFDSFVRELA